MPMEALSLFKLLWRPTSATQTNDTLPGTDYESDDEDADSFFDLEFTLSDVDIDARSSCGSPKAPVGIDKDNNAPGCHKTSSTPQSPVSILKPSPSIRTQMFRKSRAVERGKTGETEDGNRGAKKAGFFTLRLKVKDVEKPTGPAEEDDECSKRDGFMKYLKPFRVSYIGASKRDGDDLRFATTCRFSPSSSPVASRVASPRKGKSESGFRVAYKNLGKGKSACSAVSGSGADDSMVEQQEGIHGAILHCKRSYQAA